MMSREFWLALRQALLMVVDALERELGISPRTASLRRTAGRGTMDEMQPERSAK